MMKRTWFDNHIIKVLFVVAFCTVNLLACSSKNKKLSKQNLPNIIFILADDLGYMDLACHGSTYYETPNINRFAKESMEFSAFYSAPSCAPTRSALITGKSPARLNITCVGRLPGPPLAKKLPESEYSLPKIFKLAGYRTAVFGKWGIPGAVDNGFDIIKTGDGIVQSHFPPWYKDGRKSTLPDTPEVEYLADVLTSEACSFMESKRDKPFFIYLPYYAVHTPLQAPEALIEKYKNKPLNSEQSNPVYAAMVENLDSNIGRLLAKINQLEISEETIVIFTSDNGGLVHFFGTVVTSNKPLRGEKAMVYEGGIRVPFFIRWAGVIKSGRNCDTPISIEDMLPTLAEIVNIDIPHNISNDLAGASIVPLLKNESVNHRENLYWHYPHHHDRFESRPASAIRSGDWKLIDFITEGNLELYNLKDDIGENNNLIQKYPDKTKELFERLESWREKTGTKMPPGNDEVSRTWTKNEMGLYIKKKL